MGKALAVRPAVELLENRSVPATFWVTNTSDGGAGSLRQAITDANARPGRDTIAFDFTRLPAQQLGAYRVDAGGPEEQVLPRPTEGMVVITPATTLPRITEAVDVNGARGAGGLPGVEIRGAVAGIGESGLRLDNADGSTVEGLVFNGWERGVRLLQTDNAFIANCYFGAVAEGTGLASNRIGLQLDTGSGTNSIRHCYVVGNTIDGIRLQDQFTDGNEIAGNTIVGNKFGIVLLNAGGDRVNRVGVAAPTLGNVIAHNTVGVLVRNQPGLDAPTGNSRLVQVVNNSIRHHGNQGVLLDRVSMNRVGGDGANEANTFYSNLEGVAIQDFVSSNNSVVGNFFGVLPSGTSTLNGQSLGHVGSAVRVWDSPDNVIRGNTIAGTNPDGALLFGLEESSYSVVYAPAAIVVGLPNASGNLIQGNRIGTNPAGTVAIPNKMLGINVTDASGTRIIGNTVAGTARGGPTGGHGIFLSMAPATVVSGNNVGTNSSGTAALPNEGVGIAVVNSARVTIGGLAPADRNLVSGNAQHGIYAEGATNLVFQNNWIGTKLDGDGALGNGGWGIALVGGANVLVGGGIDRGNLVSANAHGGIVVLDGATGVTVRGNFVGVDRTGERDRGNGGTGVEIKDSPGVVIGGAAEGEGNTISGNGGYGLSVSGESAGARILGNRIGASHVGGLAVPNELDGIWIESPGAVIGSAAPFGANVIAGNRGSGVVLDASGAVVVNNRVGFGTGPVVIGNGGYGLDVNGNNNRIGGAAGEGNVVADNGYGGVYALGVGNVIRGNEIGVARNSRMPGAGVLVGGTANAIEGNTIRYHAGMGVLLAGDRNTLTGNVISSNGAMGVSTAGVGNRIGGAGALGNTITGNVGGVRVYGPTTTGVVVTGNTISENADFGIRIDSNASGTVIGGPAAGDRNTIRDTFGAGIGIRIESGSGNEVRENAIYNNAGLGIDLGPAGVTPNDSGDTDAGANGLQNFPVLINAAAGAATTAIRGYVGTTPSTAVTLRFFTSPGSPDATGYGEGQVFWFSRDVITDATGSVAFDFEGPGVLGPGTVVSATATTAGGTSEFAKSIRVPSDEFGVTATTLGDQRPGGVAADAGGNFVVVWQGAGPHGPGVYFRRFAADGTPLDPADRPVAVGSGTVFHTGPDVAVALDGRFVVVWNQSASGNSVVFRRFAADGTPLDPAPVQVNTTSFQTVVTPAVGVDGQGNFVVAWQTGNPFGAPYYEVAARRFDAAGRPLDPAEFRVNAGTPGSQVGPAVAVEPGGEFVVAWLSSPTPSEGGNVVARRFDAAGQPLTGDVQVNVTGPIARHTPPGLAVTGGGVVVAWGGRDFGTDGIRVRRFTSALAPIDAAEVVVAGGTGMRPDVAAAGGGFVVVWDEGGGVRFRRYAADGTPLGAAAPLSQLASGLQTDARAVMAPGGETFAAVWAGEGQDGSGAGVFGRRFGPVSRPPLGLPAFAETPQTGPVSLRLRGLTGDGGVGPSLTFEVTRPPSNGRITGFNPATGDVTYTPDPGYHGPDDFDYVVRDAGSGGRPARVSEPVTVALAVLAAPVARDDAYDAGSGRVVDVPAPGMLANDHDPDSPALALVPESVVLESGRGDLVVRADGSFTFTPAADFGGEATFRYAVTDGHSTAVARVTLRIPPPDVAPQPGRGAGQLPPTVVVGGAADGQVVVFAPDRATGQYSATPVTIANPFGGAGGAVRTAAADIDGDGTPDSVLVTGPGVPLRVAVVSGADNRALLVGPFDPFGGDFLGGGYVAAADLDGDGRAEFVVTP
ncbi:right-handed parallel beta-helix repeat-containing protein, partial [bacterium]|nr:right-handed parallel beta-helix repeat-containing protein [bacterium]